MRVALLIRDLGSGGAQRQVVTLARGLKARGESPFVVSFYRPDALDLDASEGIAVHDLRKRGPADVLVLFRLARLLRRERPDAVYSFLSLANVAAALVLPALRGARLAWGLRMSDMRLERYARVDRLGARLEGWLRRVPHVVIANSVAGREVALRRGFDPGRVIVVPNGIDTERFRPDAAGRARERLAWGVPGDAPVIGMVARPDPMKDHATFLRAAALLAARRPDVRLACAGPGPRTAWEGILARARELGLGDRVAWLSEPRDLRATYSALDVLALSSAFGEGFPNVVGEAMACGTPCVVTRVGDSASVVGDLGIVVPPGDPEAMATGLERAIAWRREDPRLGERTRERVVREFSVGRLADRTMEALRDPDRADASAAGPRPPSEG